MLLVNNIKLSIDDDEGKIQEILEKKFHHPINSFQIRKKSLDARKKPVYVCSVIVDIDHEKRYLSKDVILYKSEDLNPIYKKRNETCIIAGYGPSGLFAAERLSQAGYDVIVFEKGKRICEREKDVERRLAGYGCSLPGSGDQTIRKSRFPRRT